VDLDELEEYDEEIDVFEEEEEGTGGSNQPESSNAKSKQDDDVPVEEDTIMEEP
jgi:hypothetical protein